MTPQTRTLVKLSTGETLTANERAAMQMQLWGAWTTTDGVRRFEITDRGRTILKLRTGK